MYTVEDRNRVRDYVLQLAESDRRVVAGAVVGSLALSEGDRWSDLDLTFAVADEFSMYDVLEDWTRSIVQEFNAAHLFDLPSGPSIYRVFLIPGNLQFDLSFTPASKFGATGPKFRLLFGSAVEKALAPPPFAPEMFGYAVHHLLRARFCIERGRFWQAEYWISSARDYALNLACLRRGLPAAHGRGFDNLPIEVHEVFAPSLVRSLERDELLRALTCVINGLLSEVDGVEALANQVQPQLRELTQAWDS
jgi:hypothetical protein